MTTDQLETELEKLVDACGVAGVLDGLSGVCGAKAEHILTNWQDVTLASHWQMVATKLGRLAGQYEKSGVPGIHS